MKLNIKRSTPVSESVRAQQVSAMFDVPAAERSELSWEGDFPFDESPWNVGLIVGPSGSGKSTILGEVFGAERKLEWKGASVIDDFDRAFKVAEVTDACSAVGFNTIPAWLRPFPVLSNGEKFRVELARRLLEQRDGIVVVDEFTSVVDRQVAQIASHAVGKYIRRLGRKFVAASCHYDIIDWLQPDWVLDASTMTFTRRLLQRRPKVECFISRVHHDTWQLFSPYHYLNADLSSSARCYALKVHGRPAAFVGIMHRPHALVNDIWGVSRAVTLPDWQGLGLIFALFDVMGAAYKACGYRLHIYPAHPPFVRSCDKNPHWKLVKEPGTFSPRAGETSSARMGGRPCAVFRYIGPAMADVSEAEKLLSGGPQGAWEVEKARVAQRRSRVAR